MDPLVAFLLGKFAAAAGTATFEGVLRELLDLRSAQADMLKRIEAKVDLLITGPMNTGLRELEDALDQWREPGERERLLWDARRSFNQALGQDPEHLRRSFVALHLSATWLALDKRHDAFEALREAHVEAAQAARVVPRRMLAWPVWVRAEVMPYLNALAATRRRWGDPPSAAPRFVSPVPPDDQSALRTWEAWAAMYASARLKGESTPSEQFVNSARRRGVPDVRRLEAAMEEVEAGTLRTAETLDEWIAAQHKR
jgi:hypothetical protein